MSNAFTDPDGDPLTHAATTSSEAVLNVALTGSELTVTGVSAGTASVTVRATDPGGLSASQSFTVEVAAAAPSVSITTLSVAAAEGEVAIVAISVSSPPESPLLATYSLVADDDDGTSDADAADYDDPAGGTVTIAAGATTAEIHITIVDDDQIEPPREVLVLRLDASTGGEYWLGSEVRATVMIEEGVCDRTPQVRDAIVQLLADMAPGAHCGSATSDLLSQIEELSLNVDGRRTIAALRRDDFRWPRRAPPTRSVEHVARGPAGGGLLRPPGPAAPVALRVRADQAPAGRLRGHGPA